MIKHALTCLALTLMLGACGTVLQPTEKKDDKPAQLFLKPSSYTQLPAWNRDTVSQSLAALEKSCALVLKRDAAAPFSSRHAYAGTNANWQPACQSLSTVDRTNDTAVRSFFETHFTPYQMFANDKNDGLFTGYYEASLKGSATQTGVYQTPLYKRPADLVMVDLGDFREELKGQRIAGRVIDAKLKPYENRAQITQGALINKAEPLLYVDDAVDAFFLEIQGSGRVVMTDGSTRRIGFDGQNGHPYIPIGRVLVERGELKKEDVSMQTIRAWLDKNPDKAAALKNENPSYVFFRELTEDGPVGGSGLTLTAGRSLAVDYTLVPYHAPVFIDVEHPTQAGARLSRLMVAQDTGGAIRGPVRGDVFWGYGDTAEQVAGVMKSRGQAWLLLPKTVTPPASFIK